jgi:transcriptional regulator with XRE-family HTH domain
MDTMNDTAALPTIGSKEWGRALGQTIKVRRTDVGLSRQQLADASSISYSYLSAIEIGAKTPSARILQVLANRLGMEARDLLAAVDARLAGVPLTDSGVDDTVVAIVDDQEQRFRERQQERLARQTTRGNSRSRQALVALINTLHDDDVEMLTRIAQGLLVVRRTEDL